MSETPKVSVIILAYNYARFLPAAIESAVGQTFADCEVIVLDNGSTDETPEVVRPYADKIIYHRLDTNLGRAGGKNAGLERARGEFIQFLDADDTLLPAKVERSLDVFEEFPDTDVVYCDTVFVNETGVHMEEATRWYRDRHFSGNEDVLVKLLQECFLLTHDAVIRRKAIDDIRGFDASCDMLEDWDFWLRLAVAGKKFRHLPETLARYNWHPTSITKNAGYIYQLRHNMVYKLKADPDFERTIGTKLYRVFLEYQHRALASSLYTLGRWKETRKELSRSFRKGGYRLSGKSASLYLKSFIKGTLQNEKTSQD